MQIARNQADSLVRVSALGRKVMCLYIIHIYIYIRIYIYIYIYIYATLRRAPKGLRHPQTQLSRVSEMLLGQMLSLLNVPLCLSLIMEKGLLLHLLRLVIIRRSFRECQVTFCSVSRAGRRWVRPSSLLRFSLLRFVDSTFLGDSPWT